MKGYFSRDTFHVSKHFSRVLSQMGRVQLDADTNEQTAILLHLLRSLARNLIGPHGGPADHAGFSLTDHTKLGLVIRQGKYYVEGILIENKADVPYLDQPDYPVPVDDPLRVALRESDTGHDFWVYLDVWERHITWVEDDDIREKALGGPDTCTRAKVVWQVKARVSKGLDDTNAKTRTLLEMWRKKMNKLQGRSAAPAELEAAVADHCRVLADYCAKSADGLTRLGNASMRARVDPGQPLQDPSVIGPSAGYLGAENNLYRVEIHHGGKAGSATFKWSRENGSVITSWLGTYGEDLQVAQTDGFEAGDWVELSNDELELRGEFGVLVNLAKVQGDRLTVDLASIPTSGVLSWSEQASSPKVRRWDQVQNDNTVLADGAVPIEEGEWIDLEHGVQVWFEAGGEYRTGDYWLIPARTQTADIEWPEGESEPPRGIVHHYAPIGFLTWHGGKMKFTSCRHLFDPLAVCESLFKI